MRCLRGTLGLVVMVVMVVMLLIRLRRSCLNHSLLLNKKILSLVQSIAGLATITNILTS